MPDVEPAPSTLPTGDADALLTPPQQARSKRTLQAILDAALGLLAEEGVQGATVQGIVARAGVSVGSFYARFSGKDDLLRYLELRLWEDARARWDRALEARSWDGLALEALVEGIVGTLLEAQRVDERQRRALGQRVQGEGAEDPAVAFHAHLLEGVRSLLLDRTSELRHPDPSMAVLLGYRAVVGALREVDARGDAVPDERLVAELARLWLAYLGAGVPEEAGGTRGPVDFFDVWE